MNDYVITLHSDGDSMVIIPITADNSELAVEQAIKATQKDLEGVHDTMPEIYIDLVEHYVNGVLTNIEFDADDVSGDGKTLYSVLLHADGDSPQRMNLNADSAIDAVDASIERVLEQSGEEGEICDEVSEVYIDAVDKYTDKGVRITADDEPWFSDPNLKSTPILKF